MLYLATDRRVAVVDPTGPVVEETFVPPADGDDDLDDDIGADGVRVECVAASRSRPDRAFVGTAGASLFRTADGGGSWSRVPLGPAADGGDASHVTAVAVAPWDADVVFAGTEPSRVYRSIDGGDSFAHLPGLVELPSSDEWAFPPRPHTHHVRWLEPDPGREGRVLVAVEAGALVVLDVADGTTARVSDGTTARVSDGTTARVSDGAVADGTASFRERPPGARRDTHSMATHPDAPGRVYAAAGDGYAERARHGDAWEHPQDGLGHRYCWSVAVDPANPDVRLVSAATGARSAHTPSRAETYVYRKRGDAPWERATEGLGGATDQTRPVLAAGEDAGEFYAVSNRGLYRTTDAGESWTRLDVSLPFDEGGGTARGLVAV